MLFVCSQDYIHGGRSVTRSFKLPVLAPVISVQIKMAVNLIHLFIYFLIHYLLRLFYRQQKTDENRVHRDHVIATDGRSNVEGNKRKKKVGGGNGDVAFVTRVMIEEVNVLHCPQ